MIKSAFLLVSLVLVLAACGGSAGSPEPDPLSKPPGPAVDVPPEPQPVPPDQPPAVEPLPAPPAGSSLPEPRDVVLSIVSRGGFVPVETALAELPSIVIYADGTIVRPGPRPEIYPGPLVPTLEVARLQPETVAWLTDAARASGVFDGNLDFGYPGVTDLDSTSVSLLIDGERRTASAYALYEEFSDDPALTPEQREARDALMALVSKAFEAAEGAGEWNEPSLDRLLVWALPYFERSDLDPGSPIEWPLNPELLALDPDTQRACTALAERRAEKLVAAATPATALTPWLVGDERFQLVLRPQLTDADVCSP